MTVWNFVIMRFVIKSHCSCSEGKIRYKVPADTGLLEVLGTPRETQRASVKMAGTRGLAGIGRRVDVAPGVSSRTTRWNGATNTRAAHVAGLLHRQRRKETWGKYPGIDVRLQGHQRVPVTLTSGHRVEVPLMSTKVQHPHNLDKSSVTGVWLSRWVGVPSNITALPTVISGWEVIEI